MGRGLFFAVHALALLICLSCARERPLKDIIPNGRRVLKSDLQGVYAYLRSLSAVRFSADAQEPMAPGMYLDSDKLVRFQITEKTLDVVSVDPLYREDRPFESNNVLLSFPARHVDVLRKQNVDGEDTNEIEETESRHVWSERAYLVIDLTTNLVDTFKNVRSTSPSDQIEIDRNSGTINFSTTKQLAGNQLITETYSFLKFQPRTGYEQRVYSPSLQERFGFYKTTAYGFDRFGRLTTTDTKEYMNRWDASKPIVYYLSEDFPEPLKPMVRKVFSNWNRAFQAAIGRDLLELRENSGQKPGDLRYNLIVYDDVSDEQGLLGYGPITSNPRTGEILKGDVFLYGRALRRAIYAEREWAKRVRVDVGRPVVLPSSEGLSDLASIAKFSESIKRISPATLPEASAAKSLFAAPNSFFYSLQTEARTSAARCATPMSPEVMSALATLDSPPSLSDEELEKQIFTPLLTHELGHTLGLRHNFMASADARHFHPSAPSSSVMDYGFLSRFDPIAPGPYDVAALRLLYGFSEESVSQGLSENFLFCTDEQLYDSHFGLCSPFDSGQTLSEVALSYMRRYLASFYFNNVRADLFHFGYDSERYVNRVLSYLVPLRLLIDHADAITTLGKQLKLPLSAAISTKLYELLRGRIETTAGAPDAIEIEYRGEKHYLDLAKIHAAVTDAAQAKRDAFSYLALIVTDEDDPRKKGNRPEHDERDPFTRELEVKGVLLDKLLAFATISARTEDPLGSGKGVSLFYALHEKVAPLFSSILSNTETVESLMGEEKLTRFKTYHPALRELALEVVLRLAEDSSLESGEIKELLRVERVRLLDDGNSISTYQEKRDEYRTLLFELESNPTGQRKDDLGELIRKKRREIDEMNFATANVRDGLVLKARPVLVEFGVQSAAGLLLRDNLGLIEDRLWVIEHLYANAERQLALETEPTKIEALKTKLEDLIEKRLDFRRYLETEKSLIENWYRRYSPQ